MRKKRKDECAEGGVFWAATTFSFEECTFIIGRGERERVLDRVVRAAYITYPNASNPGAVRSDFAPVGSFLNWKRQLVCCCRLIWFAAD